MKPIIKWPGGKRKVADFICAKIEPYRKRAYIEPFCGGAAVFLKLNPEQQSYLGDFCNPLINMYISIRENGEEVSNQLEMLCSLPVKKETYLDVRSNWDPRVLSPESAATLIYLNKMGFNGLFRLNKSGKFNTPWGGKDKLPKMPSRAEILEFSKRLSMATLYSGDFQDTITKAMNNSSNEGFVIYADPPYLDTYDGYTGNGFGYEEHVRLSNTLREAALSGAKIFASNIDSEAVRDLYNWAKVEIVPVYHSIGATGDRRKVKSEVFISNDS